jgi:hypothetical protein
MACGYCRLVSILGDGGLGQLRVPDQRFDIIVFLDNRFLSSSTFASPALILPALRLTRRSGIGISAIHVSDIRAFHVATLSGTASGKAAVSVVLDQQ